MRKKFGELECLIIQKVKEKKKVSVVDVQSSFKEKVAYTTIMTVMNRLCEKKVLSREKKERHFLYWLNDDSYFSTFLKNMKEKIFAGKTVEMVSYLLEKTEVSKNELEKIDQLIQKAKEKSCK